MQRYAGRFAPSPTGPLHAGSLVAALASWLDARAHGGVWLVRIEDVDVPRCVPGMDAHILGQLAACGLLADEGPLIQSRRAPHYAAALATLITQGSAYPCGCTRQDIAHARTQRGAAPQRHSELAYPGTCREGLHGKPARAWRLLTENSAIFKEKEPLAQSIRAQAATDLIAYNRIAPTPDTAAAWPVAALPAPGMATHWHDRRLGAQSQVVSEAVGDFVLRRADGLWAYQLAVVVDDAAQGITDIVRGEDLADNTARQILLQRGLGLPTPGYLHTPLVLGADGEKLSKQNGAAPLDLHDPLAALNAAAAALQLPPATGPIADALAIWTLAWAGRFGPGPTNRMPP